MSSQSGKSTVLSQSLSTTATTIFLASPPTTFPGRGFMQNGAIKEWVSYTGVTGTSVTGVVRNLSQTADPITGGTGLAWPAGSSFKVVFMHDQLADATRPFPIYSGTTAQLAALTGVVIYSIAFDTTLNAYVYYNGSSFVTFASGTIADATPSVGGKVKISTADTGNTPVVLNSTDNKYIALAGQSGTAPSVSNKFEDNADTSVTAVASKLVRGTSGSKIDPSWLNVTFGGDGTDGALTITSGATNIDCANAAVVIKNYTSVSITGTGQLTFSNPHANGTTIIIRSQGAVTLTSSTIPNIDASGMGAAGGAGGAANTNGSNGSNPNYVLDLTNHYGALGTTTAGGAGGVILTTSGIVPYTNQTASSSLLFRRNINIIPGAGGGGGGGCGTGGTGSASGGNGGKGGGALLIECAGALNFTSTLGVSVAGNVGATATATGGTNGGAGAGGGGAAGMCVILYNTLTAGSGTINTAGGAGGTGGTGGGAGNTGGGGAGAGAFGGAGGAGGSGGVGSAGAGTSAGGGGGSGRGTTPGFAGGNAGASDGGLLAKNTYFY